MPKGGKVVAEGAYGCVVSPPPKCSSSAPQINNSVAKLFATSDHLDEEYALAKEVSKIDKDGRWSVKVHEKCEVQVKDLAKEDRTGCSITDTMALDDLVSYMVMDYGGPSLESYIDKRTVLELKEFCFIFETCLSAMIMMHVAGFMHLDIKPGNILYDKSAGKCYLIDFSLMQKMDNTFFSEEHDYILDAGYLWYPPEFSIVATRPLMSYGPQDVKHMLTKSYGTQILTSKEISFMVYEVFDFVTELKTKGTKDTWQIMNTAYKEVLPKVDVFSLGLSMLYLYRSCVDKNTRISSVEDIMMGMVRGNVFKRTTAYDAYQSLMTVIKTRFQAHTLMTSAARSAPAVAVAPAVVAPKTPQLKTPVRPKGNMFTKLFKKKS